MPQLVREHFFDVLMAVLFAFCAICGLMAVVALRYMQMVATCVP